MRRRESRPEGELSGAACAGHVRQPVRRPMLLRAAGVALGRTYPQPVIGHAEGRARALAAYADAKAF